MLLSSQQSNARPGGHKKVPGIKSGGAAMSANDSALRNDVSTVNHPIRIFASRNGGSTEEFATLGSYAKLCHDLFYFLLSEKGPGGVCEHEAYELKYSTSLKFTSHIFRHVQISGAYDLGNLTEWEIKEVRPIISFVFAELWAAFRIEIENPLWLFYARTNLGFTRVDVPKEIYVEANGSFSLPKDGYIGAGKHPWPFPLLNFRSPAYRSLSTMLTREDQNILTMLAESVQPYAGLARTLIKKLSEIKEQVLLSSPWPNEPINLK
jgi:hypothetical protein